MTLAWRVRPELRGVAFEEIPPVEDTATGEATGDYLLRAYADGERFSLAARNLGEWRDVGAVLALLNRVLEARGSAIRFAALTYRSPTLSIVFGSEAALREADALGVLRLGDASEVVLQAKEESDRFQKELMGTAP